jgi:hypothetical protein
VVKFCHEIEEGRVIWEYVENSGKRRLSCCFIGVCIVKDFENANPGRFENKSREMPEMTMV